MSTTRQNLKRLREAGMSQSEISRRAGIPQPRISRWESGDIAKAADDAIRLDRLATEVCDSQAARVDASKLADSEPNPPQVQALQCVTAIQNVAQGVA